MSSPEEPTPGIEQKPRHQWRHALGRLIEPLKPFGDAVLVIAAGAALAMGHQWLDEGKPAVKLGVEAGPFPAFSWVELTDLGGTFKQRTAYVTTQAGALASKAARDIDSHFGSAGLGGLAGYAYNRGRRERRALKK